MGCCTALDTVEEGIKRYKASWQGTGEEAIMDPKPLVGVSYAQINQHFSLWVDKNIKAWIEIKCCRQSLVGEEKSIGWAGVLL